MSDKNESYTVIGKDGKILFFGLKHFITDIVKGGKCFICGKSKRDVEFNNEHVIPQWILRKFDLYNKKIKLPNGSYLPYGQYKVPCCKECNQLLSVHYEKPVSDIFKGDYDQVISQISGNKKKLRLLYRWLCLLFFKTHLKDKFLLENRNKENFEGFIGDRHYWEDIHHVHCLLRQPYTNAEIERFAFGTFMIFPVSKDSLGFDYIDSSWCKTIAVQIGDCCLVAVLNDAYAVQCVMNERINDIEVPLNTIQVREFVAHMNYINLNLKERPEFYSFINGEGHYRISAKTPERWFLVDKTDALASPGKFLRYYIGEMTELFSEDELNEIEQDKRTFLFT